MLGKGHVTSLADSENGCEKNQPRKGKEVKVELQNTIYNGNRE